MWGFEKLIECESGLHTDVENILVNKNVSVSNVCCVHGRVSVLESERAKH